MKKMVLVAISGLLSFNLFAANVGSCWKAERSLSEVASKKLTLPAEEICVKSMSTKMEVEPFSYSKVSLSYALEDGKMNNTGAALLKRFENGDLLVESVIDGDSYSESFSQESISLKLKYIVDSNGKFVSLEGVYASHYENVDFYHEEGTKTKIDYLKK